VFVWGWKRGAGRDLRQGGEKISDASFLLGIGQQKNLLGEAAAMEGVAGGE
jgi:hypothetical protein